MAFLSIRHKVKDYTMWKATMSDAGVVESPETYFLEECDRGTV
jgi:hypothetical protein